MIETKELRIGNYVLYKNNEIEVQAIDDGGINEDWDGPVDEGGNLYRIKRGLSYEDLDPIPITSEWLKRCGFVNGDKYRRSEYDGPNNITIGEVSAGSNAFELLGSEWPIGKPFKYLHHLQNLYFALTNEELAIHS